MINVIFPTVHSALQAAAPPSLQAWLAEDDALRDLPWTAWSSANRLAVSRNGGIDLLDPRTGVWKTLVGQNRLAEMARAARIGGAELDRPDASVPDFSRFAYRVGKSVFVYEVAGRRLTRVDQGEIPSFAFSPDGRRLAYAKDRDLYVWTAATGKSQRLTTAPPRILNGVLSWVYWEEIQSRAEGAFAWSPDSRRVAYLQTDESPVRPSVFVDFDGPPPTLHSQTYPFAGGPNPKVRVGVISAEGGDTTWLKAGASEYVERFGWTPKGAPWALTLDRRQIRSELWLGDLLGVGRRILYDTNPQWVNLTDDVRFLPDGTVLMNSQRDGYDRLYRWSGQGAILNAVTPPHTSLAKPLFETHGLLWVDPRGTSLVFAGGDPQNFGTQAFRASPAGKTTPITSEPGSHAVSVSPDGVFVTDEQTSLDGPPRLVVRRIDGRVIAVLSERRPLPPGYQPAQVKRVPARDGFGLPAYVRLPFGYDPAKRYPAIVSVYGGPGLPQVLDAWRGVEDQFFASAGYVVFVVDPRSATLLDERLPRSVKGHAVSTRELNDLVDAVRWLKTQPYVDPARVGLFGWSGGGSFTLLGLTRSKEFAAGVAVAPVTDWRYYDTVYAERLMGLPAENPKGYAETALWRSASSLHGRLLMMYGTHDDNVHPINEEKFLDALIGAGKTAEVMVYPNRKHDLGDPAAYESVFRTMLDFFGRSLGVDH